MSLRPVLTYSVFSGLFAFVEQTFLYTSATLQWISFHLWVDEDINDCDLQLEIHKMQCKDGGETTCYWYYSII